MEISSMILIVIWLALFETISSVDNAIINAEVLSTMQPKYRRMFLVWWIFFAVFVVRWVLPWLIVYLTAPELWLMGSLTATFSNNPTIHDIIEWSAPMLMLGWWIFLIFLFFHWLFIEPKNFWLKWERFFQKQWAWFFAVVSVILCMVVWYAMQISNMMAFAAVVGSTAFFITHWFKQFAEQNEKELTSWSNHMSDISKILYLEVIDATFSIDGVLWAFAFTLSVPLILIGNGLGAFVVREMTIRNISKIKKYKYLKNWAMYSILFLGVIMLLKWFAIHIPEWVSPIITFGVIWYFFFKSKKELAKLNF